MRSRSPLPCVHLAVLAAPAQLCAFALAEQFAELYRKSFLKAVSVFEAGIH
jgi:hypothetical protein